MLSIFYFLTFSLLLLSSHTYIYHLSIYCFPLFWCSLMYVSLLPSISSRLSRQPSRCFPLSLCEELIGAGCHCRLSGRQSGSRHYSGDRRQVGHSAPSAGPPPDSRLAHRSPTPDSRLTPHPLLQTPDCPTAPHSRLQTGPPPPPPLQTPD